MAVPESARNLYEAVDRLLRRRNLVLGLFGIACLFLATFLDLYHHVEYGAKADFFWWKAPTWIGVLKELGFALLIALFVSIGIEEASRKEFNDGIDARVREVQQNVFRSTYGTHLAPALMDEVELLVLRAPFVRNNYRNDYVLELVPANTLDTSLLATKVVRMTSTLQYSVRNVSLVEQDYLLSIGIEKPLHRELQKFVAVRRIAIGGKDLEDTQLAQMDQEAEDTEYRKRLSTKFSIKPGDQVDVQVVASTVKQPDDSEIWRSVLPSDDMEVTVTFPDEAVAWGATALHRNVLTKGASLADTKKCQWRIRGAVLPHQGIAFWWRCSPTLVAPSPAQVVENSENAPQIV